MREIFDLVPGVTRSGDLLYVSNSPILMQGKRKAVWCVCVRCGCGKLVRWNNFVSGLSRSCGRCCKITHGMHGTPECAAYYNAKNRVFNTGCQDYPAYGGRGVGMSPEWLGKYGPQHFLADMGPRPKGHSLGRIDNDGPYGWMWIETDNPGTFVHVLNCRWETPKEQAQNRRMRMQKDEDVFVIVTEKGNVVMSDWCPF